MNTDNITLKELNHPLHRFKNKKTPGPDGVPSELYKWLNEDSRQTLLKHLNECWESEPLEDTQWMTQASPRFTKREDPIDQTTTDLLPSST